MSDSQARTSVGVGGILADIVYHDAERTPIHKVLTTADDLSIGVMNSVVPHAPRRPL